MDNRFFKYSSTAGFRTCLFVNTSSVWIHIHAANLGPTPGSRSNIYVLENSFCTERPIIQEEFPEFAQCVFSELHRSCSVFIFQDLLEAFSILCYLRFHSRSTLAQLRSAGLSITSSGASSQKILLEPPSLAPPRVCRQTAAPEPLEVNNSQIPYVPTTEWDQTKYKSATKQTKCISFSHNQVYELITYGLKIGLTHQPVQFHFHRKAATADSHPHSTPCISSSKAHFLSGA